MYGYGLLLKKINLNKVKAVFVNKDFLIKSISNNQNMFYLILDKKPSSEILKKINVDVSDLINNFYFKYFVQKLSLNNLSVTSAESLTGGLFQSSLTEISGVSKVFSGGIVSYSNKIKNKILQVPTDIIKNDGVVSENTVYFMSKNVKKLFNADISISFSGVAGPEQLENNNPGTVWIGIVNQNDDFFKLQLNLDSSLSRNEIRKESVFYGIKKLVEII